MPEAKQAKQTKKKVIGKVTHYFPNVRAAVVMLEAPLKKGDRVFVEGHGNSFEQEVASMQINREPIEAGKKGQEIAIQVNEDVKRGDVIYKG